MPFCGRVLVSLLLWPISHNISTCMGAAFSTCMELENVIKLSANIYLSLIFTWSITNSFLYPNLHFRQYASLKHPLLAHWFTQLSWLCILPPYFCKFSIPLTQVVQHLLHLSRWGNLHVPHKCLHFSDLWLHLYHHGQSTWLHLIYLLHLCSCWSRARTKISPSLSVPPALLPRGRTTSPSIWAR